MATQIPISGLKQQVSVTDGTSTNPSISFSNDTNTGLYRAGTDVIAVTTGGSERMRVLANGNVGIGTTDPKAPLHVSSTSAMIIPKGTTQQQPSQPVTGSFRLNETTNCLEYYIANIGWLSLAFLNNGGSPATAAPSALYLMQIGIVTNGYYWIKPYGYTGIPFQIYCDMTGSVSGIGSGGWMMVEYASDRYTEAAPWTGTGNNSPTDPPYSGDFQFRQTNQEIAALKSTATEIRQTLQSFGNGSVGWTYNDRTPSNAYGMGCRTITGHDWKGNGNRTLPTNCEGSFAGWNASGLITPIGIDPTDVNDNVWRESVIYLRETSNVYLPILGIYNFDVDAVGEARYFPLLSGQKSFVWIR